MSSTESPGLLRKRHKACHPLKNQNLRRRDKAAHPVLCVSDSMNDVRVLNHEVLQATRRRTPGRPKLPHTIFIRRLRIIFIIVINIDGRNLLFFLFLLLPFLLGAVFHKRCILHQKRC